MTAIADLLGRLVQALASLAPVFLAWLAGRKGEQASAASAAADVQKQQLEAAAKPHETPDRLLDRMRSGGL